MSLRGVGLRVARGTILRGVDLDLPRGSSVCLTGANGSGKTTLLRVLATLRPPTEGTGHVLGASLATPRSVRAVRPSILLVGHTPALHPELTLAENLELDARVRGIPDDRIGPALAAVGLAGAGDRPARRCSQGMLRRTEFARAWLRPPSLLLVDEAHAALDRSARAIVERLVHDVTARGGAAVLVSHAPDQLDGVVDRTIELRDGRVEVGEVAL